ncbi:MAG: hypothetical protein AAFW98_04210, partial [Pseudomonadota bacterium]
RLVVAIAFDEPFSSVARLVAYGAYTQRLGCPVVFALLPHERERRPFDLAAFSPTLDAPVVAPLELEPAQGDVVMFSTPRVHHALEARYGKMRPRFVHLIQSGVAASVLADMGYGYRLLHKPLQRIVVSECAEATIRRLVVDDIAMTRIDAAFDLAPFAQEVASNAPLAVAINAFDGDETGQAVDAARERGFAGKLHVVTADAPLEARAAAYRRSAVLLSSPRLGEGVCQPAWEAMAAGCAIVMADCEALQTLPGTAGPAHVVRGGHVESMANALLSIAELAPRARVALQRAAQEMIPRGPAAADAEADAAGAVLGQLIADAERV